MGKPYSLLIRVSDMIYGANVGMFVLIRDLRGHFDSSIDYDVPIPFTVCGADTFKLYFIVSTTNIRSWV